MTPVNFAFLAGIEKTASVVFLTLPIGLYRIVNKAGKPCPFGKALVMGKVQLRNPPYPHFAPELAAHLEVCEQRDRKGLYAKARAGIIKEFTGISDPYEAPESPEMVIDTREMNPDEAAHRIIVKLESLGYIR